MRGQKGFTLIEILIVLALMAVLAAIVIPNVQGFLGRGKDDSYKVDKKTLQAAVDGYYTKNSAFPSTGFRNASWTILLPPLVRRSTVRPRPRPTRPASPPPAACRTAGLPRQVLPASHRRVRDGPALHTLRDLRG